MEYRAKMTFFQTYECLCSKYERQVGIITLQLFAESESLLPGCIHWGVAAISSVHTTAL